MSDMPDRLRAARKEVVDALTVAIEDIEDLRVLYAHACDSCRREGERADRAEARIDGFLDRIAMANAEARRSTAELAAISTLIVGDGTAEEILAKLRARLNTRTT